MEKFAVVFPGQGSQSVGMMTPYTDLPVIQETFAEASDALGENLWDMAQNSSAEFISQTVNTQTLMLTAGVAVWRAWLSLGGKTPTVVAGHSLGEYAALVAAGVLTLADAVRLVRFRAEVMQQAVPVGEGAMAALIGLTPEAVDKVCAEAAQGQVVSAANLNSLTQIVIAGSVSAVERAMECARAAGAKRAVLLPVSAPFHCALMKPAADKLAARLMQIEFSVPKIAVLNNVDVAILTEPDSIRDALVRQAYNPVRWVETIETMCTRGVAAIYECGPGKVLTGLIKRIEPKVLAESIVDTDTLKRLSA